jgi:peptidyl-prolyl cis-trans isomerase A (cyclophilin A)
MHLRAALTTLATSILTASLVAGPASADIPPPDGRKRPRPEVKVPVAPPPAEEPPPGDKATVMRRAGPIVKRDASGRLVVEDDPALRKPSLANDTAPDLFRVRFVTTRGPVVFRIERAWSPRGADRFWNLVRAGYFSDIAFFRVIPGFMAQFGIHGNPEIAAAWREASIDDDPVRQPNRRGTLTFATSGPNSRTTQLFINFGDNSRLDAMGFSPIGEVESGMQFIDMLHGGYGEGAPAGKGPDQMRVQAEGNPYLRESFPLLDFIVEAEVLGGDAGSEMPLPAPAKDEDAPALQLR